MEQKAPCIRWPFDVSGKLFAVVTNRDSPTIDFLVTIDSELTGGGAIITIRESPGDMDGLAFTPVQRIKSISKAGNGNITIDSFPGFIYQLQQSNTPDSASFTKIGSS